MRPVATEAPGIIAEAGHQELEREGESHVSARGQPWRYEDVWWAALEQGAQRLRDVSIRRALSPAGALKDLPRDRPPNLLVRRRRCLSSVANGEASCDDAANCSKRIVQSADSPVWRSTCVSVPGGFATRSSSLTNKTRLSSKYFIPARLSATHRSALLNATSAVDSSQCPGYPQILSVKSTCDLCQRYAKMKKRGSFPAVFLTDTGR